MDRVEREWQLIRKARREIDADTDYARTVVIERGVVPEGMNPAHLTLRNMIDLLAGGELLIALNRLFWKIQLAPSYIVAELRDGGVVVEWDADTEAFVRPPA